MRISRLFLLIILLINGFLWSSCNSTKKAYQQTLYFNDITDSLSKLAPIEFEQKFLPGDILYINVITPNKEMAAVINQPISVSASVTSGGPMGYLVENDSTITFPLLGKIKVGGRSKNTFTEDLTKQLKYYVDSPIVTIRLLNYRITMLGELNKPGTITIPNERVNILDAIGLAGDLTLYGIRDSIRVIRQSEGRIESGIINLNSGRMFDSPYFYLKQNDIVYVKMQKRKLASADQQALRNISIGLGILSTIGLITTTIINISK